MKTFKVTNEELFNKNNIDFVEFDGTYRGTTIDGKSLGYVGTLHISFFNGKKVKNIWGEHGANDYEEEFGFILVNEYK